MLLDAITERPVVLEVQASTAPRPSLVGGRLLPVTIMTDDGENDAAGAGEDAVDNPIRAAPSSVEFVRAPRLVVGVGASAGGLESLERLFAHMPADTGFAFVVVQHLSPHHKTMMVELLARRTSLDVRAATHGVSVRRDTLHLMPPGKRMTIADGRLLLEDQTNELPSLPIDRFFASLGADVGTRAVAIVLSGTGADGSRALRDVKSRGGLVLAETEVTATFSGMPDSAVASGYVDYSLAPEEMVEVLQTHVRRLATPDERGDDRETARGVGRVLELLHERYSIDFTQYKSGTIERRIERRMELAGGDRENDLPAYVERLVEDVDELDSLYHDLLIGVTQFFRDPLCFEALEIEVLPRLFAQLPLEGIFRAWVAGCASGEEAYTIAMLVQEQIESSGQAIQAKIFATDLHQGALAHASFGVYSTEQLENVSETRRARHFEPCEGGYRVVDAVRRHVIFARHDLLGDAPFTQLDLVTCRNLLIYFQVPAQQKAMRLFHFALRIDGALMLGPSETLGRFADDFSVIDEPRRLYRKSRAARLPDDMRFEPPSLVPARPPHGAARRPVASRVTSPEVPSAPDAQLFELYDALLDRHMPPSVLIDADDRIVDSYADVARFLRYPSRRPDGALFTALDTPATEALRDAVRQARVSGESVNVRCVTLRQEGGPDIVRDVRAEPLDIGEGPTGHVLLEFGARPMASDGADADIGPGAGKQGPRNDHAGEPHSEIAALHRRLQLSAEIAETGREELQATNEELVASNEELQSSNEELNSVNEELHTVNSEYQGKLAELRELNEDMQHLLASTDIGTVFLDREMRIRRFTSGIHRAYDLTPGDIGRPIGAFAHRLVLDDLLERFTAVMNSGIAFEREVRDRDGRAILLRILPYQLAGQVAGVVMTLVDIELLDDARVALADSEASLKRRVAELQMLYKTAPAGLCFIDRNFRYVRANERMAEIDGVPLADYVGHSIHEVLPPELAGRVQELLQRIMDTGEPVLDQIIVTATKAHPIRKRRYVVNYYPVSVKGGETTGCSCVVVETPDQGPGGVMLGAPSAEDPAA